MWSRIDAYSKITDEGKATWEVRQLSGGRKEYDTVQECINNAESKIIGYKWNG
jgi:hypothetical protein